MHNEKKTIFCAMKKIDKLKPAYVDVRHPSSPTASQQSSSCNIVILTEQQYKYYIVTHKKLTGSYTNLLTTYVKQLQTFYITFVYWKKKQPPFFLY